MSEQKEKLNCSAVATQSSSDVTRSSRTRKALQICPELRQRTHMLHPCIKQSLARTLHKLGGYIILSEAVSFG